MHSGKWWSLAVWIDLVVKKVIWMLFEAFEPVFGQSVSDSFVIAL
jgi:hypothetical protein